MQRFYVLLDGEITQEKTEASVRRHMAPHPVEFTHIEWFSKFESTSICPPPYHDTDPPLVKERVATAFTHPSPSGPFILAGDAAHVHSVNGGQGMNTGLSDAFSLIWRLHLLLHFPSLPPTLSAALLSSYDTERRATAAGVIDVAAQLVRSTMSDAKGYVALIEKNSSFITGMGVQYSGLESPLVQDGGECGVWKAGHRAPDLWLAEPKTNDAVRLYQRIVYGRYLLVIAGLAEVKAACPEFLSVLRVAGLKAAGIGARKTVESANEVEIQDHPDAYGCSWVKKGEQYAVLIRPDCYVETVGRVEEVVGYLERRLPGLVSL